MGSCDLQLLLRIVDEYLVALGTSTLVDGTRVRDQLLDLRLLIVSMFADLTESEDVLNS